MLVTKGLYSYWLNIEYIQFKFNTKVVLSLAWVLSLKLYNVA